MTRPVSILNPLQALQRDAGQATTRPGCPARNWRRARRCGRVLTTVHYPHHGPWVHTVIQLRDDHSRRRSAVRCSATVPPTGRQCGSPTHCHYWPSCRCFARGGLLEVIVALAGIGTAATLFPVVRRQNEGMALGFVAIRTLEAGMIHTGVVTLHSLVTLRQTAATGADAASLVTTGKSLVATYNWTFLIG